jgi:hypothetical protein
MIKNVIQLAALFMATSVAVADSTMCFRGDRALATNEWANYRVILNYPNDVLWMEGLGNTFAYREVRGVWWNEYGQHVPVVGGAVLGESQFTNELVWKVYVLGGAMQPTRQGIPDEPMHIGHFMFEMPLVLVYADHAWLDPQFAYRLWQWNERRPFKDKSNPVHFGDDIISDFLWRVPCSGDESQHLPSSPFS